MDPLRDVPIEVFVELQAKLETDRHAAEVRYVAAMPTHMARADYLAGVAEKRGDEAAQRLRRDVWELMRAKR